MTDYPLSRTEYLVIGLGALTLLGLLAIGVYLQLWS